MKWVTGISIVAWIAVLATIDGSGSLPTLEGPGITLDESFNIDMGWYLIRAEWTYGLAALVPQSQTEIFGFEGYNPDHPPLGRLCLGLSDAAVRSVISPSASADARWSASAARPAAATAFALTVFLAGWMTFRWTNRSTVAASVAALALATTPRVFGHAHIASLESFIGLAFAGCVFWLADQSSKQLDRRSAAIGGFLWGLALLTKIQAVLIPIPFAIWGLAHYRQKAIVPGVVFGLVGFITFFLGWPWLWIDPVGHILEYFGRGSDRIELNVFFSGLSQSDRSVNPLYTLTMFLVTIPLHWQLLAGLGTVIALRDSDEVSRRRWRLVLGTVAFVLLFFSLPNIAVYDGSRLFLVAYPLWACLTGLGAFHAWKVVSSRLPEQWQTAVRLRMVRIGGIATVTLPLVFTAPCWLSHYSLLVGGLPGATALGFEPTYWGDSLTRSFVREVVAVVPKGSRVAVTPVLHQFQLDVLEEQYPLLSDHQIELIPYAGGENAGGAVEAEYLIAFRRRADLPADVDQRFQSGEERPNASASQLGVLLAGLFRIDRQASIGTKE